MILSLQLLTIKPIYHNMNSSQNNIDIEKRSLEEIATKYQLFDEYKRIFLCRFDRKNAELQNTEIAGDKHLDIDEQELQKYLRKICDLFGHKVNKRGRPKSDESPWKNVFDDLWNNRFNEWLKLQKNPNIQIPILNDDDWLKVCHTKLEDQSIYRTHLVSMAIAKHDLRITFLIL